MVEGCVFLPLHPGCRENIIEMNRERLALTLSSFEAAGKLVGDTRSEDEKAARAIEPASKRALRRDGEHDLPMADITERQRKR